MLTVQQLSIPEACGTSSAAPGILTDRQRRVSMRWQKKLGGNEVICTLLQEGIERETIRWSWRERILISVKGIV